jgi:hypothetical protein
MRRNALAVAAVAAALAGVAASAASRGPAVAVPRAVDAPAKGPWALLAVVPGRRGPVLGRADKRALWIARRSPRLRLDNALAGWAYSPERDLLAVATEREAGTAEPTPAVQFIQPHSLRRLGTTRLDDGYVAAISWAQNRVNVVLQRGCCPASLEAVSIDTSSRRVVARQTLANALVQSQRVGGTLVLLVGPPRGVGTATLVTVDPSGAVRSVALSQILAGSDSPSAEGETDPTRLHQNIPALALDPAGRAFVVPASGPAAEITLSNLDVSYHSVAQPVSLLGRLHDWVEPNATAKGVAGPIREARWLGSGVLAVSGGDEAVSKDAGGDVRISWTPAGLRLIDTNTWGSKVLDRGADAFTVERDNLLATGARWDSLEQARTGMGLVDYGFDGSRRLAVLRGRAAAVQLTWRGRAYVSVSDERVTKVVDLRTGALLKDRRAPLAQLLIGDAST